MAWFDCATRRAISNNIGGNLSSQRGLVLHHQAGNGSLYQFFNNPASKVSAHFWVSKGGIIEQYIDTARVAWHGKDLNSNWVGVETEGCGSPPHAEAMTAAMESALARLYAEGARRHGWPNQLASSNGGRGFGFHRMAVNTACPCERAARTGAGPSWRWRSAARFRRAPRPPRAAAAAAAHRRSPPPPTSTSAPTPATRTCGPGSRRCATAARSIGVDGAYGPESERVCRSFQADKRLTVDGKVGPQTWNTTWTSPVSMNTAALRPPVVDAWPLDATLRAVAGDPFSFRVQLLDGDGQVVDVSAWTWAATVTTGQLRLDFEWTADAEGVRLWLRGDDTARLPARQALALRRGVPPGRRGRRRDGAGRADDRQGPRYRPAAE